MVRLALVCILLVAACGGTSPSPSPQALPSPPTASGLPRATATPAPSVVPSATPAVAPSATVLPSAPAPVAPSPDRDAGWLADLDALLSGMERLHPDLFHGTSKVRMQSAIADLRTRVPGASDDELMAGVLRIVALVSAGGRDGHTGAFVWGEGTYPVQSLPLRLWRFSDGWFVVDALDPHRDLIGSRIEVWGGHPIDEVTEVLDPFIPRDNATTVTLLLPRYLLLPELLHGMGLIPAAGPIDVGLVGSDGRAATVRVEPIPLADYNAWAGPYGLFLPGDAQVPYLANAEEPLWFRFDAATRMLVVQYNRVQVIDPRTIADLAEAAARPDVRRLVVDIRHNYGGQTSAYRPVFRAIEAAAAAHPGALYVITGRNTFSAGALFAAELDAATDAVFVGEPMGGSPSLFGNSRPLVLRHSGIVVQVATGWNEPVPGDTRLSLPPDLPAPLSSAAYFGHRDPALEAILAASN